MPKIDKPDDPGRRDHARFQRLRRMVGRSGTRRAVDLSHPARSPLGSAVVNCVVYQDGKRRADRRDGESADQAVPAAEALRQVREGDGDGFVWIGLHEPTTAELTDLAEPFGLHPLAIEDAVKAHQRPKVERYDDTLFAVFKTVCYVEHDELTATSEVVDTGEIMVFTGPDFVITVRHGRHGSLGPVREALEADPEQLAHGPTAVLHAIADHVVDEYLSVTDSLQDDVDAVESDVFSPEAGGQADAGRIYQLKRELLELKRATTPLGRPLQNLATRRTPLVDPAIQPYFRDVADHLAATSEHIASFDTLLDSILQAHLAQVTVAQNEDMRKITAWAAVIAVPTMVCGVYGMNFDFMPETKWTFGYPLIVGLTACACFLVHRAFRRRGWL